MEFFVSLSVVLLVLLIVFYKKEQQNSKPPSNSVEAYYLLSILKDIYHIGKIGEEWSAPNAEKIIVIWDEMRKTLTSHQINMISAMLFELSESSKYFSSMYKPSIIDRFKPSNN